MSVREHLWAFLSVGPMTHTEKRTTVKRTRALQRFQKIERPKRVCQKFSEPYKRGLAMRVKETKAYRTKETEIERQVNDAEGRVEAWSPEDGLGWA